MSLRVLIKRTSSVCVRFANHWRYFSNTNGRITSSYYHERGTFLFTQSTLGDLVDEAAEECGDDIGFSFPFQNIKKTFNEFKQDTDQLAAGLISLGLKIGDRIAIYGPNSYQWLCTQYAAFKAGLIVVSINPATTEKELSYTLNQVECQAIVVAESFKKRKYYEVLCDLIPELPKSHPGQISSQRLKHLRNIIMISDKDFPGTYRLEEVAKADDSAARRLLNDARNKVQFDSHAFVTFTSGTTGTPKAATASHFQIVNQAKPFIKRIELDEKSVICLQVPLFHSFGNMVGPPVSLQCRGKCVFPFEHFEPVSSLKAIEEEKCTVAYGVPTMFNEIVQQLRRKQYNINHWKKVVVGAAPVPLELMKTLREEFGLNVMNAYGATEVCSALTSQSPLDSMKTFGSVGKPVEFVEIKIVDKHGEIVPVNTNGEVLSRTPFQFIGYWNQPEKTAEVVDSTRWYHTGDIGRMNEEGYVYITGRIKDMVIRGGVNIYPTEIENFLLTHPAIEDVYVVGVPDQRLGEELCASIKLKPESPLTEDEVKEFCKDKISYFKIPRYVLFCENYPKTESGKIKKYQLREECMKILKL